MFACRVVITVYLLIVSRGMIPLCDVGIPVGETLVVSAENKPLIAIATGTLTTVTDTTVTMVVDRWAMIPNESSVYYLLYKLYKEVHKHQDDKRLQIADLDFRSR